MQESQNTSNMFADRISDVPRSFIREILKVTLDPSIISFAGGLPNRDLFPCLEIEKASNKVLTEHGKEVLQYSTTEGYDPLREWIAERYKNRFGLNVSIDEIIILHGSQQGMDLIGKVIINEGDHILLEKPSYLGAIQAFSLYHPIFHQIPLMEDGPDIDSMLDHIKRYKIKMFYGIPNFQNPAGISYSAEKREKIAEMLKVNNILMIEDDPYGELRFYGSEGRSLKSYNYENTVLLGTFSKIIAPSLRVGWAVAKKEIMEKLVIAKQANDLHTNYLGQRIIHQFLLDNSIDDHIKKITARYKEQRDTMIESIKTSFPSIVRYSQPDGGMFLWVTLPDPVFAMDVFNEAQKQKVIFVPGEPFYASTGKSNTMRLNFSCMDSAMIKEGIGRLGDVLKKMIP